MNWRLGWKTILGGLLSALGYLSQPDVFAVLPKTAAAVVTAVGMVLGVFGIRQAVAKVDEKVEVTAGIAAAENKVDKDFGSRR